MSAATHRGSQSAVVLNVGDASCRDRTDMLESAGFTVIEAESGRDALRKMHELQPDLVLLPPALADIAVTELCRCIKGNPDTAAIPILETRQPSSGDPPDDQADSYLTLPVAPRQLVSHVRALLRRGHSRAALLRSLQQAEGEEVQRRQEFLAILSHELRNPLAPIRTALDLLRLRGDAPPPQQHALAVIDRQLQRLVQLLDGLLDISRLEQGRLALQRGRQQLQNLVDAALELSADALRANRHRLQVDLPAQPLWLEADVARLPQALANVIRNAAKFTPAGGQLKLTAHADGAEVEVAVIDSGIGLDDDERERIFQLFEQGRQLDDQAPAGLGVGLSLARRLVELHGGTLSASSEGRGRGATFRFRLPLAVGDPREIGGAMAAGVLRRALRVLLVDDSVDGVQLLQQLLEQLGHEVRVAHNGADALALAPLFRPEVALLDIGLPDMTGYQLAQRLQCLPTLARTRLVALTGYGQSRDRDRALASGFAEHLVKPIELDQLIALLAQPRQLH